jgi:organic radical activating enzyme
MAAALSIDRLEIIVTYACNSNCSHCLIQPGEHRNETIAPDRARELVALIAKEYHPLSIMTFGGEPLLPNVRASTFIIHKTATEHGILHRQILTNGNWIVRPVNRKNLPLTHEEMAQIQEIAHQIADSGVNDVGISADAFHLEHLDPMQTRSALIALRTIGIKKVAIHPRWLVGPTDMNAIDMRTRALLEELQTTGVVIEEGEVIQPRGNALKNYCHIFHPITITGQESCRDVPNAPCLNDVRGICVSPRGDIIVCNNIIIGDGTPAEIVAQLQGYDPQKFPEIAVIQQEGLQGLIRLVHQEGGQVPSGPFFSICDACFQYRKQLKFARTCNA